MTADSESEPLSVFRPDFDSMTRDEVLAFVERTRRQMDRFDQLPGGAQSPIDPAELAAIRRLCDELEADLLAGR